MILKHDGRNKLARVHRLVMLAFAGEPPEGHEVNHIDGNKANNSYLNLEYVTRAENVRHAVENGLMNGASNGKRGTWSRRNQTRGSKLTIAQVREIRQLRAEGVMVKDIAQMYGVHRTLVSLIVNRHIWLHA